MSVGTEPTSLPEYHQAQLSTVHYQFYSYCRFQGADHRLCGVFPINLASDDFNDERDRSDWSSYMSSSRMRHRWGLFLGKISSE